MFRLKLIPLFLALFLVSCGGGGGGGGSESGGGSDGGGSGGNNLPFPTVTIISYESEVEVGTRVTLEWSSNNSTSCNASGAWSGTKSTNGSEVVTISQAGTSTYSLSCSNSTGSASSSTSILGYRMFSGIVLDGYIRGSEVFADTNENNELDADEFSVITNNDGVFSGLKFYQGKILAKDGIDLDTGFIFENFTLQTQRSNDLVDYIISPVTSVGSYLTNPSDINTIFGISSEIDVYSVDPIPLIDDTKYAKLYSIGNRLNVLAMGMQNFEATNKDLLSYLSGIAEAAQISYDNNAISVQIDDPDFVRSVLDTILDTDITDDFKSSLTTMLSNSLYLLKIRDNSNVTTGIQNFAFTTLQDDITQLKNCSSASSCDVVNNYVNDIFDYVANDQNLLLSDVAIPIQAFDDILEVNEDAELSFSQTFLLANDNYLKGTGTSFQFTSVSNGKFLSSEYQSFRYLPNQDFNGTDTFTYTIGQAGQESIGIVTINVAPVNDSPTMESLIFTNIGGGTLVFGNVDAFDVDGDSLSYVIGGTDGQYISVTDEGDLSFTNTVSYASPSDSNGDNIYEFTVTVNDGSISVMQNFSVEVFPGGSPPVFLGTSADLRFYENTSITIQINASDPDGDEMSLSISSPEGFSITSNANGFEISNSNGLAAGTYTVEGVITDNNFNTPFTFNFRAIEDLRPGSVALLYKGLKANQTDQRLVMNEVNRGMRFNSGRNPNVSQAFSGWNSGRVVQEVEWYAIQPSLGEINKNKFTISVENPHQFSVTFGGGGTSRNNTTGLLAQMGRVVPAVNDLVGNISYPQYLEMNIDRENDFNCSGGGSVSTRTSEDGVTEIFGDFSPLNNGYESSCTFSFTVDYTKKVRRSKNILDTFLNGIPDGCNENICLYPPVFHDVFGALESDSDGEGLTGLNFDIIARNVSEDGSFSTTEINGGSGDGFTVFMDPQLERPYLDRQQDGYKQVEVTLDEPPNGFEDNYSIDYVPYIDLKIDTSTFLNANREFEIKFITDTQNGEWEVKRDSDKSQLGGYCDTRWINNSEEVSEKCVPVEIISIDDDSVTFKVKEFAFNGVLSEYNQQGVPPIIFFDLQIVLVNKSTQESLGFQNSYLVKLELEGDIPSGSWTQIGNDIDGKFFGAESGKSVAMDADGGIAIGAPAYEDYGDNYVQVFDVTDSSISQVGEDIIGSNGGRFGHAKAVDISSDGNVLIVGAPEAGIVNDDGIFGGEVTIWRLNDTGWTNEASFYGNPDLFGSAGRSTAISNNGDTIVFGDYAGKTAGSWEGSVKVFRYINSTWTQIGETIYGDGEDYYASVVDINGDGTKIAIGAWRYSDSRGHVRIFQLNQTSACLDGQASNGCWSEIGEIVGTADQDQCGTDISMDQNGNTIAILCSGYDGTRGQVKIFDYNDGTWAQHGSLINGEAEQDHLTQSGSVALGSNGDYIIIGSNFNDGTAQEAGHARIFKYNSECTTSTCAEVDTWIQVGRDIDGESFKDFSGFSVAINALGTRVAIGAPQNDGDSGSVVDGRGHVRIYKWVEY